MRPLWASSHVAPRHATRSALTPGSVGHGPTSKRPGAVHSRRVPGRENRRFPAKSAISRPGRSLRPASRGAPPPASRPALDPRGVGHALTSAGPVLRTHARARGVGNEAGGAGRPGGVDVGPQNHFWGVGRSARTSHSRVGGTLSEVELRSWRKVIALRRWERCERPRQRPELQTAAA